MKGFMPESMLLATRRPLPLVPQCGSCGLLKTCKSPKMPIAGKGLKKIFVLGEGPGEFEDLQNKPFVGKAGQKLQRVLEELDISLFRDCWVGNALSCRPINNKISKKDEIKIEHCRPLVISHINRLRPEKIILLGARAVRSVIGYLWKENPGGIRRWAGWHIPAVKFNCWICPTFHPSYVMRADEDRNPVPDILFRRHLRKALAIKSGVPYETPLKRPRELVRRLLDARQVKVELQKISAVNARERPLIAFDFETDRLKPDHPDARICACSVSNGKDTIAFPWSGMAKEAMADILFNPEIGKVASNLDMEDRWIRKEYGREVVGWDLDTVLSSHAQDNRRETKGIKFRAFVELGVEPWDDHIKKFLKPRKKGAGDNEPNRIRELMSTARGMDDLLVYCGMDGWTEWHVAMNHKERISI